MREFGEVRAGSSSFVEVLCTPHHVTIPPSTALSYVRIRTLSLANTI